MDSRTAQAAQRATVATAALRADGEIRTLTDEDLNLVPLPLGYVGDSSQDTDAGLRRSGALPRIEQAGRQLPTGEQLGDAQSAVE